MGNIHGEGLLREARAVAAAANFAELYLRLKKKNRQGQQQHLKQILVGFSLPLAQQ